MADQKLLDFAVECAEELAQGVREAANVMVQRLPSVDPDQRVFAEGFVAGVQCAVEALEAAAAHARGEASRV
jgi:hypothetical protein